MDIYANTLSNPNKFPTMLEITPNGTLLNLNGPITVLSYTAYAGSYFLNNLTLAISAGSPSTSAAITTLTIPGPGSVFSLSDMVTGSGLLELSNHNVNSSVNDAISSYITSTGLPINVEYNGNDKTGTWTVTISGNTTVGTSSFLPSGQINVSVQCTALDDSNNTYYWGDINGVYDIERVYWYYIGELVLNSEGVYEPMLPLIGAYTTQYLRLRPMGTYWTYLALQQIAANPSISVYESLFPLPTSNPLIREDKVAAQGYSFIFGRYLYSPIS